MTNQTIGAVGNTNYFRLDPGGLGPPLLFSRDRVFHSYSFNWRVCTLTSQLACRMLWLSPVVVSTALSLNSLCQMARETEPYFRSDISFP